MILRKRKLFANVSSSHAGDFLIPGIMSSTIIICRENQDCKKNCAFFWKIFFCCKFFLGSVSRFKDKKGKTSGFVLRLRSATKSVIERSDALSLSKCRNNQKFNHSNIEKPKIWALFFGKSFVLL